MEKMSWIVSSQDVESLALQSYSRKEKSLGVLVSNFMRLYNRDDVDLFGIDEAAAKLGVERRRIYDVVNILESIGVVARKGKSLYSWNGFVHIPRSLLQLKEEGLREGFGLSTICSNSHKVSHDGSDESDDSLSLPPHDQHKSSSLSTMDHKKERSLWLLSQNFVKMFLCSHDEIITLDTAAKALLNDSQDSVQMKTKVRRLYDIANVLSSMELIEKTHIPGTRKPAYKWLGSKSLIEKGSTLFNSTDESKKRVFGTEITNLSTKRNKTDCSSNYVLQTGYKKHDEETKPAAKSCYMFGPFSPTAASKKKKNNNVGTIYNGRLQDLEALSSTYKPQYSNQDVTGLLGHYTGSWNKWFAELDRK
ncbi:E2F transcription factor-like E2FF [Raphanus sativus]|uniref:E2F transcription factor-like E2FF n=1 Tax=Raphanus sativus TaxID=3726 RepID=A0A6J0NYY2_RAPSA|nr:E2F transcription factor-like E2FF [Raphanus sativus]